MNREDIIRMAREAGLAWVDGLNGAGYGINTVSDLERFFQAAYAAGAVAERERIKTSNAPEIESINDYIRQLEAAVVAATEEANRRANASWSLMCEKMVAAERKACAKVCEGVVPHEDHGVLSGDVLHGHTLGCDDCAAAIRARGQA